MKLFKSHSPMKWKWIINVISSLKTLFKYPSLIYPRRIDNMEAAFLPGTWLGHGWACQKLTNLQAIFWAGCKDLAVIWLSVIYQTITEKNVNNPKCILFFISYLHILFPAAQKNDFILNWLKFRNHLLNHYCFIFIN